MCLCKSEQKWSESNRSLLHSLQKKVHAALLFTAIELTSRARSVELRRAINYAISDIAWRTILQCICLSRFHCCVCESHVASVTCCRRFRRVSLFLESATICATMIVESKERWLICGQQPWFHHHQHCCSLFFFLRSIVARREWEDIHFSVRCISRSLTPAFLHLFIFNVELCTFFFFRFHNMTPTTFLRFEFHFAHEIESKQRLIAKSILRIMKSALSVSSSRVTSFN